MTITLEQVTRTNNYRTTDPIPKQFNLTDKWCKFCGQPLAVEPWNSVCNSYKCVNPLCPLWYSDQAAYLPDTDTAKPTEPQVGACSLCGKQDELTEGYCLSCWDAKMDSTGNPLYNEKLRPVIIRRIKEYRKAGVSINRTAALLGVGRNSVLYYQKEENV